MSSEQLFEPYSLGPITLANKLVMAPMTRSRAIDNLPNDLMATYYRQRASAGLIISEATASSPNSLGYARIPGAYSSEQVAGWKKVTQAVHEAGGKIFLQVFHTGRISHPLNMPNGAEVLAPSAVASTEKMWTDQEGQQELPTPRAMSLEEIQAAVQEYRTAAANAIKAGFDGFEVHAANGYLINQFLNPQSNKREDRYGGSPENRSRFLFEVVDAVVEEIGKERVGVRISPFGTFNTMDQYDGELDFYTSITKQLSARQVAYLHVIRAEAMGAQNVPEGVVAHLRQVFQGTYIVNGGYDRTSAIQALEEGTADLVCIGKPFISNPDLAERYQADAALNDWDSDTFYSPGAEGYTDYPTLDA